MNIRRINLSAIPLEAVKSTSRQVRRDLGRTPRAVFDAARDHIAHLHGRLDFSDLKADHAAREEYLRHRILNPLTPFEILGELNDAASRLYLSDPSNYEKPVQTYFPVELAMRFLFEDYPPAGIQIGSSFGPYLYYLKNQRGYPRFFGIDVDPYATRCAKEMGTTVIRTDASALPLAETVWMQSSATILWIRVICYPLPRCVFHALPLSSCAWKPTV